MTFAVSFSYMASIRMKKFSYIPDLLLVCHALWLAGSFSLPTTDHTRTLGSGSVASSPLDHQGIPPSLLFSSRKGIEFCQLFFSLTEMLMWFLSILLIICLGRFSLGEPSLHSGNKCHLVVMYNSVSMLLSLVC